MPTDRPIRNRDAVTDAICDVMHQSFRDVSIDRLLTRPFDAMRMAVSVLARSGRIAPGKAKSLIKWIDSVPVVVVDAKGTEQAVADVLRTALASRKRGDLKMDRY